MPKKYHVQIKQASPRFAPVPKFCGIEKEGCLGCLECVKRVSCIYGVWDRSRFDPEQIVETGDVECLGCLRCVQECKKGILSRILSARYRHIGDDYWIPGVLRKIWRQSESGKIPVSGAGFRGPFSGPGFDRMWTDMSEIVRPTRDGIHGREYISTLIEVGRKPARLEFDHQGKLFSDPPPFVEIPVPVVLDLPDFGKTGPGTRRAFGRAAANLQTLAVARSEEASGHLADFKGRLIVRFDPEKDDPGALAGVPVAELEYQDGVLDAVHGIRARYPGMVVSVRLALDEHATGRAAALARDGADVIHLVAGRKGRGFGQCRDRFIIDLVREIHLKLVDDTSREQVTILASGGIALAEHVAKIIICGADGVGLDLALLVALECRLCHDCDELDRCEVALDQVDEEWGAQRITNLLGSWHSQLIEVLGAMGIREVRRLRGEVGRAMFVEDLERENFAPLFKNRQGSAPSGYAPIEPPPGTEVRRVSACRQEIRECPSRFRNQIGKYKVLRSTACIACGKCLEVCSRDVHRRGRREGRRRMLAPLSHLCMGPEECRKSDAACVDHCPQGALRAGPDPLFETVGDPRWPPDLVLGTWRQAETGRPPGDSGLEYRVGASGGGLDRMEFVFPGKPGRTPVPPEEIDLSIPLNRSGDGREEVTIGFPVYGGGMSFGSISLATMVARARAYTAFDSFTCTGEGGYPEELKDFDHNVITQVATGLFGVSEDTIMRVRIVEFKYAQGAKPGLGGHLLGDKVTPTVARMREAVEGSSLFSPFPFHSVYSVEDHKKHVDWIKAVNPRALVSVKVSTPTDVDMVAVGSYYAGAHIIHIDGSYGGTGAAPDIAKKNIAMPVEYAIPKVHNFLVAEGVRDKITLMASGGLRTAWDVAKAIALGADGVVIGTAELVALECTRCGNCESGRGCPRGIATTDSELAHMYDTDWAAQRLVNLLNSWCIQLQEILWRFGMRSIRELVGRTDLLLHRDYV
jgi:glutamate synthase domain-containing protein 2/NAD-dependent dihydropyrimidine dehydrogenase PreA subunit